MLWPMRLCGSTDAGFGANWTSHQCASNSRSSVDGQQGRDDRKWLRNRHPQARFAAIAKRHNHRDGCGPVSVILRRKFDPHGRCSPKVQRPVADDLPAIVPDAIVGPVRRVLGWLNPNTLFRPYKRPAFWPPCLGLHAAAAWQWHLPSTYFRPLSEFSIATPSVL